jgi:hypothetical protein
LRSLATVGVRLIEGVTKVTTAKFAANLARLAGGETWHGPARRTPFPSPKTTTTMLAPKRTFSQDHISSFGYIRVA